LNGLGVIERELGNSKKAKSHLKEATDMFQKLGNWILLQDSRHGLSLITLLEADLPKAKRQILDELATSEELNLYYIQLINYFNLLQIALLTNNSKMFAKYTHKIKDNKKFGGLYEAKMYIHEALENLHSRLRANYTDHIETLVNNKIKSSIFKSSKEDETVHSIISLFLNQEQPLPDVNEKLEKAANIFIISGEPTEISEQDEVEDEVEEQQGAIEYASMTNSIVDENYELTIKGKEKLIKAILALKIFFKRIVKRMYILYKRNKKNSDGELPDIKNAEYVLVAVSILQQLMQEDKLPAKREIRASADSV